MMNIPRLHALAIAILILWPSDRAEATVPAGSTPGFAIQLRPIGTAEAISEIEVRSTLSGIEVEPTTPFLSVPAVFANLTAQVYRAADVEARDEAGPLPLRMDEDVPQPGIAVRFRHFTAMRPSVGRIEIRYRADVTPTSAPRTLGPSYDLRGTGGGFLGGGASFLLLPADRERRYRFSLDWDFSQAPANSLGVSTLGSPVTSFEGTSARLMTAFFMGGLLHRFPEDAGNRAFNGFWIGEPNFNAPEVMAWAGRSFEAIKSFARAPEQAPYYIFARPNPNPTIGGAATANGFILEYGSNARDENALKLMFTHEMIHHFIGALNGPAMTTSWWHEGLAEFYKIRLPLRAGLIDFETHASALAGLVEGYYRNPNMNLPNAQVAARFWADRSVQNLPYARGFMYFADLDARMRAASNGRRSLDDLVLAMLERQASGSGYDETHWRELLAAELGAEAVSVFDAMMNGETIAPPPEAFGPCFTRQPMTVTRYALGFSDPTLQSEPIVRELESSSAATRAGLREGDRILRMDGWTNRRDRNGDDGIVTIHISRDGDPITISFDTRAGIVEGFLWTPTAETARQDCVL